VQARGGIEMAINIMSAHPPNVTTTYNSTSTALQFTKVMLTVH